MLRLKMASFPKSPSGCPSPERGLAMPSALLKISRIHFLALLVFMPPIPSPAQSPGQSSPTYRPKPWDNLGRNMAESVFGWPMALHVTGVGSTWLLLDQGIDAAGLRMAARQDPLWNRITTTPGLLVSSF